MNNLLKICLCISAIAIVVQLVDFSIERVNYSDEISLSSILNNGRYEAVVVSGGTYGNTTQGDTLYILDTRTGNCKKRN